MKPANAFWLGLLFATIGFVIYSFIGEMSKGVLYLIHVFSNYKENENTCQGIMTGYCVGSLFASNTLALIADEGKRPKFYKPIPYMLFYLTVPFFVIVCIIHGLKRFNKWLNSFEKPKTI